MKCPKVTLRSRPISHGRRSLYLDYYPAIRIPNTMKKTRTETLGIYVYARPRSQHEKSHNDEMYRKARLIASTRLPAIINKQYGFLDTARGNRDFLEYFRQIVGEHNSSLWKGCYNHFRFFVKNSCICAEVDIELCRKFRSYLLSAHQFRDPTRPLAHSSIVNYYLKFLSLLHNAYRDHMIEEDLAIQMEYIARKPTRREFLTPSELRTLSQTSCEIHVLKRASLFSCETGLRLSDVLALKWEDIVPNLEGNGCAIRNEMAIAFDPEGYAYKCWEVIGNKEYAIGKLNDDGILTDINQTILNRQLYGADTFDDPICSQCKYLPICNGGCPIQRIENKFEGGHNDCCSHYKGFMPDFLKIHIARKKAQEAAATEKQQ